MAVEIRIHPLDFEPDVAIGIGLPMMAANGTGFYMLYTTIDQAVANSKNLLLTNKGERIMQPTFGCDLRTIVFDNITEDLVAKIEDVIKTEFGYWLPYIFINELVVVPSEDTNQIAITLKISLEGNKFDTRSIQLEVSINQ